MTKEQAIRWKPVIAALQEGKTIQCCYVHSLADNHARGEWRDCPSPLFDLDEGQMVFRVKPEAAPDLKGLEVTRLAGLVDEACVLLNRWTHTAVSPAAEWQKDLAADSRAWMRYVWLTSRD